jgi:conjugal transfer pilus assembly protein TraF
MTAFGSVQYSVFSIQKKIPRSWYQFSAMITFFIVQHSEAFSSLQAQAINKEKSSQSSSFFERRAEGWHWYQSLSDSKVERETKAPRPSPTQEQTLLPTQQIEAQRKNLEKMLHAAIIEPTQENLISYITAQKALMDQSQRFAEMWKQVVMTTPSLDETLIHPVDQNARHIYYEEQHQKLEKRIKQLASEYGLFFFFRKNCAYCHHFSPIVKRFAQKYGWSVLPISLDGGTLQEFPNTKQNNGIAERLQITHVPALIALHPKTGQLIPLAYGLTSESEIEQRVELLTRLSGGFVPGDQK